MTERRLGRNGMRLPSTPGLVAGLLVVVGVLLWMFVDRSLLFVAGLGAFGPGILRELGWLRDQDEFQRQAAHRAGYHAWLTGGLAAVLVVSGLEWSGSGEVARVEWIRFILVLMWLSWLFSALLAYWGARPMARRVLLVFGSFWLVFVAAELISDSATSSAGDMLLGSAAGIGLVAPFLVLSWTAARWPRVTGAILLIVAALFVVVFGGGARGGLDLSTILLTQTILVVPLAASGIALLREAADDGGEGEGDDAPAGAA